MSAYPDMAHAQLVLEAGVGPLDAAADPETHAPGIDMAGRTPDFSRSRFSLRSLSWRGLASMIGVVERYRPGCSVPGFPDHPDFLNATTSEGVAQGQPQSMARELCPRLVEIK